jgi:CRISPR-associated endonuclease/helicase Cas3
VVRRFGLAGFYLAMPTRATSNQAFREVRGLLDPQVQVKLLHGTAAEFLSLEHRRARDPKVDALAPTGLGIDGPAGEQDGRARDWFVRRRGLVAPVAVGTVDRLEQAAIRSWFVTLPLVGLSNRVVIVDEIHSYDTYMSTLLDRVLRWLGRLGVPVVLLSATLAVSRRDDLIRQWQAGARNCPPGEVPAAYVSDRRELVAGYPRVTWADAAGVRTQGCVASALNRDRTVRLCHLDDADLVDRVIGWAGAGRSVAVIRGTRRRAWAARVAFERAIAALPDAERPELLFLMGGVADRLEVEQRLFALFGSGADRPSRAVVVGTSVIGLSLDLDFDIVVSDLAPIDALIQRAGRLHRFRPIVAGQPPLLAITGVTDTRSGPEIGAGIRGVYADWTLLRTWALLRNRAELRLPDDVPYLVDAVYEAPNAVVCPAGWAGRLQKAATSRQRIAAVDTMKARTIYIGPPSRHDTATGFLESLTFHPKSATRTRKPHPRTAGP